ncbi:MAG: hypothetical protein QM539_04070 [Alphaproteobacteria bacterium]|nr:hypothetical protein [Alphaproteobacteria bacterium]
MFEKEGKYEILGLLDAYRNIGEETLGYKVVGKIESLKNYPKMNLD